MKFQALRSVKIILLSVFFTVSITGNSFAQDQKIFAAVETGDINKVRKLLAAKPTLVHLRNDDGFTPLLYAARFGHMEIVRLLVSKGANVNVQSKYGHTPLYWATSEGHVEIVRLLAAKTNINSRNASLRLAAHQGHPEIVKLLLAAKASANSRSSAESSWRGETPLLLACSCANTEKRDEYVKVVRLLLDAGAQVNFKNDDMMSLGTPLMRAVNGAAGKTECPLNVIHLLLAARADVSIRNSEGRTAVDIASSWRNAEIVELLGGNQNEHPGYQSLPTTPLPGHITSASSSNEPGLYKVTYRFKGSYHVSLFNDIERESADMDTFVQVGSSAEAWGKVETDYHLKQRCKEWAKSAIHPNASVVKVEVRRAEKVQ